MCGIPTIRSDIPAPRIRRISDRTNYGDEANAYALLFPSVFSQKGVYENDFFKTRPKAEVWYFSSEHSSKTNVIYGSGKLYHLISCKIHCSNIAIFLYTHSDTWKVYSLHVQSSS